MTDVLIDARLAIRGLGIATFVDRLMAAFAVDGAGLPKVWRGGGDWGTAGVLSTLGHSGLFDVSPRLDPRTRRFDVVHFACNLSAWRPGQHSVVTVHDLLHRRPHAARRHRLMGALLECGLSRAGRIVAISDRTRTDLERVVPQLRGKVEVIPHGMRKLPVPHGPREHILAFGGAGDPRKRVDHMVAVYQAYQRSTPKALPLVVLGRAGLTPAQSGELSAIGATVVPAAASSEVDALMGGAAALLYPSTDEGFGLPILEAAEMATPVVMDATANVATEIMGSHCYRVAGTDVAEWVTELQKAVAGGPVESALTLPDWPSVAASYRTLYRDVVSGR